MEKIDLSGIQRTKKDEKEVGINDVVINDVKKMSKPISRHVEKVEDVNENSSIDKERLVHILRLYLVEFPDHLSSFKGMKFEKKTLADLQDIQKQMNTIISSKSSMKQTQMLVTSSIKTLEFAITVLTPIKAQGLANTMLADESVVEDIKLVALKRMSLLNTEPEQRLLYKLVTNLMLVHNINSQSNILPTTASNETPLNDVNKKFNDL